MGEWLSVLDKKYTLGIIIMVLFTAFNISLTMYNTSLIKDMSNSQLRNQLELPMGVIEYGFKDKDTDRDMVEEVKTWDADGWGIQIVSLRTVCKLKPDSLHSIMKQETQVEICRMVK